MVSGVLHIANRNVDVHGYLSCVMAADFHSSQEGANLILRVSSLWLVQSSDIMFICNKSLQPRQPSSHNEG